MVNYRITHDILASHLVLVAGVARDYLMRYRTRLAEATALHSQLTEARLEVLQSQLNPHFLFNALNAVAALVQKDPAGARRMIALLSDLLRETLYGAAEPQNDRLFVGADLEEAGAKEDDDQCHHHDFDDTETAL